MRWSRPFRVLFFSASTPASGCALRGRTQRRRARPPGSLVNGVVGGVVCVFNYRVLGSWHGALPSCSPSSHGRVFQRKATPPVPGIPVVFTARLGLGLLLFICRPRRVHAAVRMETMCATHLQRARYESDSRSPGQNKHNSIKPGKTIETATPSIGIGPSAVARWHRWLGRVKRFAIPITHDRLFFPTWRTVENICAVLEAKNRATTRVRHRWQRRTEQREKGTPSRRRPGSSRTVRVAHPTVLEQQSAVSGAGVFRRLRFASSSRPARAAAAAAVWRPFS